MERFRQLLEDLNRQSDAGDGPEVLRQTIALLQLELDRKSGQSTQPLGTAKVAVVLPQRPILFESNTTPEQAAIPPVSEPMRSSPTVQEPKKDRNKPKLAPLVLFDEAFEGEPSASVPATPSVDQATTFNVMEEVPTLYMHRHAEINEQLQADVPSMNDRLKQSQAERQDVLREGPIADLRKAIGVNERFQFLRELFRHDEDMYERSIKTINQFKIFAEADFWINRELKTKLGWPVDHPLVKQFDQLVRRRFS
ncbi:MAG: hypothetical protein RL750_89 [Bacteroidota bacterium]|jgi:hypothetical protein